MAENDHNCECSVCAERYAQLRCSAATGDDWQDDPAADERWNAGCTFALDQLCKFMGVDAAGVTWDAATETVDGDVQAVIGNILRAKFGEDWGPDDTATEPQPPSKTPADDIISQIEERFPNWRSFRDLVDCIDCTLHDLRNGGGK